MSEHIKEIMEAVDTAHAMLVVALENALEFKRRISERDRFKNPHIYQTPEYLAARDQFADVSGYGMCDADHWLQSISEASAALSGSRRR